MSLNRTRTLMKRAIDDMERFFSGDKSVWKFVYRWGVFTSGEKEGRLIALFDDDTESGLEQKIRRMDAKFHVYTDTIVDREYSQSSKCWYATYVVMYPFDKDIMSGPFGGQDARPLF